MEEYVSTVNKQVAVNTTMHVSSNEETKLIGGGEIFPANTADIPILALSVLL